MRFFSTGLAPVLFSIFTIFASRGWADPIVIPSDVDPEKIVQMGSVTSYTLIGIGSTAALRNYMGDQGYQLQSVLGKTMITLGVSVNDDFVGCGCPRAFNEFLVSYATVSTQEGGAHVIPDLSVTNHPARRHSMATKFGTIVEMGDVTHLGNNGFEVKDAEGALIARADSPLGMPHTIFAQFLDFSFHSLGGEYEGQLMPQTFFRIVSNAMVGYRPFLPGLDHIRVGQNSRLAQMLRQVRFRPLAWSAGRIRDGRAWIPPQ